MTRTRIGMMLPGAVSLGAYEGGALAAILAAVQAAGGELAVDAIASASAGSITAVVASRALLRGADPPGQDDPGLEVGLLHGRRPGRSVPRCRRRRAGVGLDSRGLPTQAARPQQ